MLNDVVAIAKNAGLAIKGNYLASDHFTIMRKADHSPVTQADLLSHRLIHYNLNELDPSVPILSEEGKGTPWDIRQKFERYWLVDPLDGTQEFIHRTDDFAVNIALVEDHEVVMGVVYLPIFDTVYYAKRNFGAFRQIGKSAPTRIRCSPFLQTSALRVVASRRHEGKKLASVLASIPNHTLIRRGSTLKICVVAEGDADMYPRLGPTSEWDTAAAQVIIEEAGGFITDLLGNRLSYNHKDSLLNPPFLATNATWKELKPYLAFFQQFANP